ncbi:hypothetical protein HYT33_03415 [Candidatus Roizmanbacteria bacterium]|nr:hypothetical protein [Candidatus Roizmanbacteria bacterium]
MSRLPRVFIDSDVLISSVLSNKGASNLLIDSSEIEKVISNFSEQEASEVVKRMRLKKELLRHSIHKCKTIVIKDSISIIKDKYRKYVFDINDAHIVAGAVASKVGFLATYNVKDYKKELIKRDLNIIVSTPGVLLQYLRSRK